MTNTEFYLTVHNICAVVIFQFQYSDCLYMPILFVVINILLLLSESFFHACLTSSVCWDRTGQTKCGEFAQAAKATFLNANTPQFSCFL